ncbi:hypothetical protein EVAR_73453_1 [Eumeta japonica]|uniref:Uncharacterized protein n=1 Tax=Eumeta variegata TaxID=151549 RepID=A0A4C1S9M6_EUMVA|nr:hypothetical protein EVAR_73453_1 [Eumeta japonica]
MTHHLCHHYYLNQIFGRNASSSSSLNNFSTAPGPSSRNCGHWLKNASTIIAVLLRKVLLFQQSGIQLNHNFILHNAADKMRNNTNNSSSTTRSSNAILDLDTDSSADEFEDASDFNACEEFSLILRQYNPLQDI